MTCFKKLQRIPKLLSISRYKPSTAFAGQVCPEPFEHHGQSIPKADQKKHMKEEPHQPRDKAFEMKSRGLGDSLASSDRRHRTFVPILKTLTRLALQLATNIFRCQRADLHCGRP